MKVLKMPKQPVFCESLLPKQPVGKSLKRENFDNLYI